MPYYYQNVARAVALRAHQLQGGTAAQKDTAYSVALISASMDGIDVPYSALKHTILATAKELAALCASSSNPIFRAALAAQSDTFQDGDAIPTTDELGNEFLGTLDSFYAASMGIGPSNPPDVPLTEGTPQEVDRWNADQLRTTPFFKIQPYKFYRSGSIFRTTVSGDCLVRGCSWNETTQSANFDTSGTAPATFTFVAADVDAVANTITETAHGFYTGARVRAVVGTGAAVLPAPLVTETIYYVIVLDADTIQLATTLVNALTNTAINLSTTGTNGTTPNSLVSMYSYGGGVCPLPQELEVLHWCKCLAALPSENWFVPEGEYYGRLVAEREADIIEGRVRMMSAPSLPESTVSIDPNKD